MILFWRKSWNLSCLLLFVNIIILNNVKRTLIYLNTSVLKMYVEQQRENWVSQKSGKTYDEVSVTCSCGCSSWPGNSVIQTCYKGFLREMFRHVYLLRIFKCSTEQMWRLCRVQEEALYVWDNWIALSFFTDYCQCLKWALLEVDVRAIDILKHLKNSEHCCALCSVHCFLILDQVDFLLLYECPT